MTINGGNGNFIRHLELPENNMFYLDTVEISLGRAKELYYKDTISYPDSKFYLN